MAVRTHVWIRKGAHVAEYAALGGLADRALAAGGGPVPALRAAGLALAVAGADEALQSLSPRRTASARDVALDVAGAGLGIAAVRRWRRRPHAAPAHPAAARVG
jgi:VanZ family protein